MTPDNAAPSTEQKQSHEDFCSIMDMPPTEKSVETLHGELYEIIQRIKRNERR